jgi:hypothetical protein
MALITAKYVKDPAADTPFQFNTDTGWFAISRGLRLVVAGYAVLIFGSIMALVLLRLGVGDRFIIINAEQSVQSRDTLILLGILTLAVTAVCSYGLVLTGQVHCLKYAPQHQQAKELMYICVNCVLLGAALNLTGAYLDGARTYAALQHGLGEVEGLDLWSAGTLLQLSSAVLGLIASLVFSQFLRNVASCFRDRARVRSVDLNLGFVGLLLGGSIGTLFCLQRFVLRIDLLPWLAAGWLVCFAWHLYLVCSVHRCVEAGLAPTVGRPMPALRHDLPGKVSIHTLSGLHRLACRVGGPDQPPGRGTAGRHGKDPVLVPERPGACQPLG